MNNTLSIVSSLVIFLFPYIGRRWFNRYTLSSTVVSLGLLGTFIGIIFGLWRFSVDEINASIPQLLEGLKTAFLTSIAGLLASLLLKLCPSIYGISSQTNDEASTEDTLIQLLTDIRDQTRQNQNQWLTELQQIHQDNRQQITLFSEQLLQIRQQESQIHTEALIEALHQVMSRFNDQFSEQITQILSDIRIFLEKQSQVFEKAQEQNRILDEQLLHTLQTLSEIHRNLETFLQKSFSLDFKQNETFNTQINRFGDLVKTTEAQVEQQINRMEESYRHELSEMEKFTHTLMSIIKKLSQDHTSLYKSAEEFH